jgi:hypothetical protein
MSKRQKTTNADAYPVGEGIPVGKIPQETRLFINNNWVAGRGEKFNTVSRLDSCPITRHLRSPFC